jgi:hypothetical protein
MRSTRRQSRSDGTRLVDRRTMLGQVGGGALLAATAGLMPHGPTVTRAAGTALAEDNLTWMPAWRIRDLVAARDVSAAEVLEHFLNRIEEHGGTLKAFKTLDTAGARDQAKRADDAVARGAKPGSLHGIPIAVKEHIAVAGLPRLRSQGQVARRDDLGVERLRQAGAIIIGTNTMMGTTPTGGSRYNWDGK